MTEKKTDEAAKKPEEPAKKPAPQPERGDAVLLPEGGEAIVVGTEDGVVLLRVGSVHVEPVRRPAGQVALVEADEETDRHRTFRRVAKRNGEI